MVEESLMTGRGDVKADNEGADVEARGTLDETRRPGEDARPRDMALVDADSTNTMSRILKKWCLSL